MTDLYIKTPTQADNRSEDKYWKTKITMPEILATDPRYKTFAVPQMFQEAG